MLSEFESSKRTRCRIGEMCVNRVRLSVELKARLISMEMGKLIKVRPHFRDRVKHEFYILYNPNRFKDENLHGHRAISHEFDEYLVEVSGAIDQQFLDIYEHGHVIVLELSINFAQLIGELDRRAHV